MTEPSVISWSQILPSSTNTSQNAIQNNIRRTTTETILCEFDSLEYSSEDVVIHCPKCDTYVKIASLRNHKSYHKAIKTLQWTKRNPPSNLSSLIEQRNLVLSRLKDELFKMAVNQRNTQMPYDSTQSTSINGSSTEILSRIEQINRAFEYLKNDVDPLASSLTTLSFLNGNALKKRKSEAEVDKFLTMSFTSRLSCIYAVGICSTQNKMHRRDMEDAAVFKDCLYAANKENAVDVSYFAVFDGYCGPTAALVASEHLHNFLKDAVTSCQIPETQPSVDNYEKSGSHQVGFHVSGSSKGEQIPQEIDDHDQIDDKENMAGVSDSLSGCLAKNILEQHKKRIITESTDDYSNRAPHLEIEIPCIKNYHLIEKDTINKNVQRKSLENEDQSRENSNRLQLERTKFFKVINKNRNHCSINCETQETVSTHQNSDDSNEEGLISNQTKNKIIDQATSIASAFKEAYQQTDAVLSYGVGETSRVRWSGCSAATLLIESVQHEELNETPEQLPQSNLTVSPSSERSPTTQSMTINPEEIVGKLYVANVGNVQAFLVKGNRAHPLTKRHTPQNKQEKERILQQGGFFTQSNSESLVNGVLKTTRGLGNHGDKKMRSCVHPVPSFYCADIEHQSQLLIIASAGVWDVLSGQEAASILVQLLPMNRLPVPSRVSTSLMELFNNRFSTGPSPCRNDDSKIISNQSVQYTLTRSSNDDSSQRKEEKFVSTNMNDTDSHMIFIDTNEQSQKDSKSSTKSSLAALGSKSEQDVRTNPASGLSGLKDDDFGMDTLDKSDIITSSQQHIISQSKLRQHFGRVMSRYLVQAAMLAGSRQNITAMVILLPGSGL